MPSMEKIEDVVQRLWADLYESEFSGKDRGRFLMTKEQMKSALEVERLHKTTISLLQCAAQETGLQIIDLDDYFACIEVKALLRYRRVTSQAFVRCFGSDDEDGRNFEDEDDGEE